MTRIHGFPPVVPAEARVLILGSMPGAASLAAGEYYAHRRNLFWKLIASVTGSEVAADYPGKLDLLHAGGIAVWDVIGSCVRPSSMDGDIVRDSVEVNDFGRLFARFTGIRRVCFNGTTAAAVYRRLVIPGLSTRLAIDYCQLPSSSPANASIPWATKLAAWQAALVR